MDEDMSGRLARACVAVSALVPIAGFTVVLMAHERFTDAHGTGFEGYELVDGPVYRTGTLLVLLAEVFLLLALVSWYARLRRSVSGTAHVRRLIWAAALVALTAAVVVTASTSAGSTVDVAPWGIGVVLLFGAACFLLGRRAAPSHRVGRLLEAVPVAVAVVVVARTTVLEVPALLAFGLLCVAITVLLPFPGDDAATDQRGSGAVLGAS